MNAAVVDLIGQSLGPYTITARLGGGGMADVYRAEHRNLRVDRALKVIRPDLVSAEDFRARFLKEAQAVASLRHPNIVQVHDFGIERDVCFMVMEFIEGSDLKKIMLRETRIRPVHRAVELLLQIADALQYAHSHGVIHRDIKPENIMISTAAQPILTDFGIARLMREGTRLTQTGAALGTPAYMAPEQALGSEEISPATDIYALCIALYEMLTGRVPFAASTPVALVMKTIQEPLPPPQSICPDIGDAIQKVILKGTAKRPEERYDSMATLQRALRDALDRDLASERTTLGRTPPGPVGTVVNARPRIDPITVALAGVCAAVAALGGAAYWAFRGSSAIELPAAAKAPVSTPELSMPQTEPLTAAEVAASIARQRDAASAATDTTSASGDVARPTQREVASSPEPRSIAARPATPPPIEIAQTERSTPKETATTAPLALKPAELASASIPGAAAATTPAQCVADAVCKGVTTQADLLKRFGGPNLTTYDQAGREVWIYERSTTQTDVRANSSSAQGTAQLGLFFSLFSAGDSAEAGKSSGSLQSATSIRAITVIVTFDPDRKVAEYEVRETKL